MSVRVGYPCLLFFFFFSSRRRHTRCSRDWSSDVCSSDLLPRDQVDLRMADAESVRDNAASPGQEVPDRLLLPGDPAPVALVSPLRRIGSDAAPHESNLTARRQSP